MKKLNKNGWGLQAELGFILLFLICLAVALMGLNQMGLLKNGKTNLYESNSRDNETNYDLLESSVVEGAKSYVRNEYGDSFNSDSITLRLNHLVKNNYLSEVKDGSGSSCSGYVEVIKTQNNTLIYYPYLKCKNYTTFEYDGRKDW